MDEKTLNIHQCLHGYDSGHRLLASSIKLSSIAQSLITKKSDAPLPGYGKGSPSYVTGYPVPELAAYALAKTWPAPEMPRPGCVWTHTILIGYSDVARLESIFSLLDVFNRPTEKGSFDFYLNEISIINQNNATTTGENVKALLTYLLFNLYEKPSETVTLPMTHHSETALYLAWDQQWPKLRRSMRFCTYGNISSDDRSIDVVITPKKDPVFLTTKETSNIELPWLKTAISDITTKNDPELHNFLWRYGADSQSTRGAFKPLVSIWNQLKTIDGVPTKTAWDILTHWPAKSKSLTTEFVKRTLEKSTPLNQRIFNYLLEAVIALGEANFQRSQIILLGKHIARLPENTIADLLNDSQQLPRGVVNAVITYIDGPKLVKLIYSNPYLLEDVLNIRPQISYEPSFWHHRNTIPPDILSETSNTISAASIFEALIASDNTKIELQSLAERLTPEQMSYLVGLIGKSNLTTEECRYWLDAIRIKNAEFFNVLIELEFATIELLTVLTGIFPFDKRNPEGATEDVWLKIIKRSNIQLSSQHQELSSYLICRGLSDISPQAPALLVLTFDLVHSLLSNSQLNLGAWYKIERLLPKSHKFFDWDRCERLRRGVAHSLVNNKAPSNEFVLISTSDYCFSQLVKEIKNYPEGRGYLYSALRDINHSSKKYALISEALNKK